MLFLQIFISFFKIQTNTQLIVLLLAGLLFICLHDSLCVSVIYFNFDCFDLRLLNNSCFEGNFVAHKHLYFNLTILFKFLFSTQLYSLFTLLVFVLFFFFCLWYVVRSVHLFEFLNTWCNIFLNLCFFKTYLPYLFLSIFFFSITPSGILLFNTQFFVNKYNYGTLVNYLGDVLVNQSIYAPLHTITILLFFTVCCVYVYILFSGMSLIYNFNYWILFFFFFYNAYTLFPVFRIFMNIL